MVMRSVIHDLFEWCNNKLRYYICTRLRGAFAAYVNNLNELSHGK